MFHPTHATQHGTNQQQHDVSFLIAVATCSSCVVVANVPSWCSEGGENILVGTNKRHKTKSFLTSQEEIVCHLYKPTKDKEEKIGWSHAALMLKYEYFLEKSWRPPIWIRRPYNFLYVVTKMNKIFYYSWIASDRPIESFWSHPIDFQTLSRVHERWCRIAFNYIQQASEILYFCLGHSSLPKQRLLSTALLYWSLSRTTIISILLACRLRKLVECVQVPIILSLF